MRRRKRSSCFATSRWVSSWTRTYSRHAGGFLISSRLSQMRPALGLHEPHLVFMRLMPQAATSTPSLACHLASSRTRPRAGGRGTSAAAAARGPRPSPRAHVEHERLVAAELDPGRALGLDDLEAVAAAPVVVALAAHHLPRRLARLRSKPACCLLDPAQLADHRHPHRGVRDGHRRRDAHAAVGRVDPEVEVLDRLAHDRHVQAADGHAGGVSSHSGSSPARASRRCSAVVAAEGAAMACRTRLVFMALLRQSSCMLVRTAVSDAQRQGFVAAEVVVQRALRLGVQGRRVAPGRRAGLGLAGQLDDLRQVLLVAQRACLRCAISASSSSDIFS
jgi:hypothetical protein